MKARPRIILNVIAFQAAWSAGVLGAANGLAGAGTVVTCAAIALCLAIARRARPEVTLIVVAAIGFAWERAVVASGLIRYTTGVFAPGFAPF